LSAAASSSSVAFNEALAIPAIVHTPVQATKALAVGASATPLLATAARYPFRELVYLGDDPPATLRAGFRSPARVSILSSPRDFAPAWQADVIAISTPGLPDAILQTAKALSHAGTVVVVAVDQFAAGAAARRLLLKHWRSVVPYRENVPEPQLFLLASDVPLSQRRPVPGWARRISPTYLPSMFAFPKDENAALFAPPPAPPLTAARPGTRP
jgi:hypothetical protein